MKKYALILIGFVFFLIDRVLKFLVLEKTPGEGVFLFDKFGFHLTQNYGIAFGLRFIPMAMYLTIALILFVLFFYALKAYRTKQYASFNLFVFISIGALSNILDRIKYGFVVDYFSAPFWPTFNLADAIIVFGILFLAYREIYGPATKARGNSKEKNTVIFKKPF